MTDFAISPEALQRHHRRDARRQGQERDARASEEVTVVVGAADYLEAAMLLRDAPGCRFEQLIDLCGMDYSDYREGEWQGERYCVVSHLLSVSLNQRVRLKVFAPNEDLPVVDSLQPASGMPPPGSSAKPSTSTASCSKVTTTCAAS